MKCYVCGEREVVFGVPRKVGGVCAEETCADKYYEGIIGTRRKVMPKRPSESAALEDWEDFRAAEIEAAVGTEVEWLDIVYFIANDPLFRVKFLTEIAQESPRFIVVPTFTLNDDLSDWNAQLASEGIPRSRRKNARTDSTDLVNYIAWYVAEEKARLMSRDPSVAPFIIMSYRERLHESYEGAVYYNGVIIDVAKQVAHLFDPGVGLWGALKLEYALRKALASVKFTRLFGSGYQLRWLVRDCHIQKPIGVPGEKIHRDNYCQTWSLYVFYRFIVDGGQTAKAAAELKTMQSKWSQKEILALIGDDFLLGIVRLAVAYDDTLKDDSLAWSSILPVILS